MAQPEPSDAEINAGTSDAATPEPKPEPASEPASKPKAKTGGHMPATLKRSPDSSQKLIVGCMVIATANTVFANMRRENKKVPAPRIVIGGFAVAIALLFMSELQSEFAEALALVILLASLVGPNGTEIINAVTNLVGSDNRVTQIAASRRARSTGGAHYS
jgi:hypothetical protein